jgi:transcription elongation factor GreA
MMGEKFYLTKKGLEKIKKEYEDLKEAKLAKIRGEAPAILHSEDLNPEYISFKEDMTFLEKKMDEIENILKNVEIISTPEDKNTVKIGATVTLEEKDGELNEFMVVGTLEANPGQGKISADSPVGMALMNQKLGNQVVLSSPIRVEYKIKKIKYHLS